MISHGQLRVKRHAQVQYSVVWNHRGASNRQWQTAIYAMGQIKLDA